MPTPREEEVYCLTTLVSQKAARSYSIFMAPGFQYLLGQPERRQEMEKLIPQEEMYYLTL